MPVLGRPVYCCPQGATPVSTTEGPRARQGDLEHPVLWGHWAPGSPAVLRADRWRRSLGLGSRPEVRDRERREEAALPRAPSATSRGSEVRETGILSTHGSVGLQAVYHVPKGPHQPARPARADRLPRSPRMGGQRAASGPAVACAGLAQHGLRRGSGACLVWPAARTGRLWPCAEGEPWRRKGDGATHASVPLRAAASVHLSPLAQHEGAPAHSLFVPRVNGGDRQGRGRGRVKLLLPLSLLSARGVGIILNRADLNLGPTLDPACLAGQALAEPLLGGHGRGQRQTFRGGQHPVGALWTPQWRAEASVSVLALFWHWRGGGHVQLLSSTGQTPSPPQSVCAGS